jgi:hypothetical protein
VHNIGDLVVNKSETNKVREIERDITLREDIDLKREE